MFAEPIRKCYAYMAPIVEPIGDSYIEVDTQKAEISNWVAQAGYRNFIYMQDTSNSAVHIHARPLLKKLIDNIPPDSDLVIYTIYALLNGLSEFLSMMLDLNKRAITLYIVRENLDTTRAMSKFYMRIVAAAYQCIIDGGRQEPVPDINYNIDNDDPEEGQKYNTNLRFVHELMFKIKRGESVCFVNAESSPCLFEFRVSQIPVAGKCYGYTRVSTPIQVKTGNSLETQHNQILKWLGEHGRPLDQLFCDAGISARYPDNLKQRNFLLNMLTSGDMIVVANFDRFSRNVKDFRAIASEIIQKNCVLIVIGDKLIVQTAEDLENMVKYIRSAEREADIIRENVNTHMHNIGFVSSSNEETVRNRYTIDIIMAMRSNYQNPNSTPTEYEIISNNLNMMAIRNFIDEGIWTSIRVGALVVAENTSRRGNPDYIEINSTLVRRSMLP